LCRSEEGKRSEKGFEVRKEVDIRDQLKEKKEISSGAEKPSLDLKNA